MPCYGAIDQSGAAKLKSTLRKPPFSVIHCRSARVGASQFLKSNKDLKRYDLYVLPYFGDFCEKNLLISSAGSNSCCIFGFTFRQRYRISIRHLP